MFAKARGKDALRAASSLTTIVDGRRVFLDDPPVVQHIEIPGGPDVLRQVFEDYRATMADSRREFLERYRFADFALKVVGVGSVGTRCFVIVLEGRDEDDPLILQAKEATASVLESPPLGQHVCQPRRARGGRPARDAGDARHLPGLDPRSGGRDFYLRQLWDMKGSVDTSTLQATGSRVLWRRVRLGARTCPCPQR